MPPSLSVIVPTYNRTAYLGQSLRSLLGQTSPVREIFVVDDGSTEDVRAVADNLDARVIYVRKENGGKASAINAGLPLCTGDLVWVFDDDDVALPGAVATYLAAFDDPGIGWVATGWHISEPGDGENMRVLATATMLAMPEGAFFNLMRGCFGSGQAFVARRECYARLGPYRTDLTRADDYEMLVRLARHYPGRVFSTPTFHYRQHHGARGAAARRYSAAQALARSHADDQRIFTDLLPDLAPEEFLAEGRRALYPANAREALLSRFDVYAAQGLWDGAVLALEAARAAGPGPPTAEERAVLLDVTHQLSLLDLAAAPAAIYALRRQAAHPLGRYVRGRVALWLYWRARAAFSARRCGDAARFLWLAARVARP